MGKKIALDYLLLLGWTCNRRNSQKYNWIIDRERIVVYVTGTMVRSLFVRARPCFTLWSFSLIRKTELWKTNKPPAVRVVEGASAYSIKPPVL